MQPFQGRSTNPQLCATAVQQFRASGADVAFHCCGGLCQQMELPTLYFALDCKLIIPSHGEKLCRERPQKRNRGGYLTWRSRRVHDQFMSCIRPRTSAFFAWEEHFPSVCSCLMMQGSSWALKLHGPSPIAASLRTHSHNLAAFVFLDRTSSLVHPSLLQQSWSENVAKSCAADP